MFKNEEVKKRAVACIEKAVDEGRMIASVLRQLRHRPSAGCILGHLASEFGIAIDHGQKKLSRDELHILQKATGLEKMEIAILMEMNDRTIGAECSGLLGFKMPPGSAVLEGLRRIPTSFSKRKEAEEHRSRFARAVTDNSFVLSEQIDSHDYPSMKPAFTIVVETTENGERKKRLVPS